MINIAQLLKDAPKGMKLYSPLFGEVEYCYIGGTDKRIWVCTKASMRMFSKDGRYCFTHDGNTIESTECLLFPNENCRTWVGWELPVKPNFKVGDWIIRNNGSSIVPIQVYDLKKDRYLVTNTLDTKGEVMLTRQDEWHLWNTEDATDGDVLVTENYIFIFKYILHGGVHLYCHYDIDGEEFDSDIPDAIIGNIHDKGAHFRPATQQQRNLFFKKMQEAGYQWYAGKKELKKIQPHYDISNFKPFDKVLCRGHNRQAWRPSLYGFYDTTGKYPMFVCATANYLQCIPFDGNEHLLGTTDMCDKQYINW